MNKRDYNKLFEYESETNKGKKLLLHCCCAPCTLGVIERVMQAFDVTLFWYNPNIMPEAEKEKRLLELRRVASIYGVEIIAKSGDENDFLSFARDMKDCAEGGARCEKCIDLRLRKTGEYADKNGFDYFCSTLSVSPHKNADYINECGKISEKNSLWLYNDFKKKEGFKRSVELCLKYGIYRQNYCGCRL